jgi:hypothetical protein
MNCGYVSAVEIFHSSWDFVVYAFIVNLTPFNFLYRILLRFMQMLLKSFVQ